MNISLTSIIIITTLVGFSQTTGNSKLKTTTIEADDSLKRYKEVKEFSDAAIYGDINKVKKMINDNPEIVNSKDKHGFSALHNVMCEEQFDIVKFLIDKGANVNIQNEQGIAPLHLACNMKNAELLLKAGANINLQDFSGNTPLHILVQNGAESIEVIKFLLLRGADKYIKNKQSEIPLTIAKLRNEAEIIKLLEK